MRHPSAIFLASALMLGIGGCATAPPGGPTAREDHTKKTEAAAEPAPTGPIAPFAWLAGCWQGNVNQREFREQWLPLRGDMLVGAGQQVSGGKMQDYEYLRIEPRVNGIFFSQFSGDRKETSFRLVSTTTEDKDTIFTFANTGAGFPARLIYRRGAGGWLYETIEGPLDGADKRVIYPLRRVSCETGELIPR
ncbi:MAG: DUF6265 family protein [Rudaea sp.]